MKRSQYSWTEEEDEFLLDSFGSANMKHMIRKLSRSEHSIKQRYRDLVGQKDMHVAGGYLTPRQMASSLGVNYRTIHNWIHNFGLPAHQFHKVDDSKKNYRFFIDPNQFWRWLAKNKERVNFSLVKRGIILPEPDWLEVEIKNAVPLKPPRNWSTEEDEEAWYLYNKGVNYREIARQLGRPELGTQRRLTVIRKRKQQDAIVK